MTSPSSQYVQLYSRMLADCLRVRPRGKQAQVTAFWPVRGSAFRAGESLLVIGRAVNGWTDDAVVLGAPEAEMRARDVLGQAQRSAWRPSPLAWLEKDQVGPNGYRPRRSQFWATARGVASHLDGTQRDWTDRLAWSNLYKIAPHSGGNPGSLLRRAQHPYSEELLEREVADWRPGRILILAGWWWTKTALPSICRHWPRCSNDPFVEATGSWADVPVVVACHPQGREIAPLVDSVRAAFASA